MNTIARTLSTLTAAAVMAFSTIPAMAADSQTIRLVERADGTLAVYKGGFIGGKSGQVLASTTEEISTFITPLEEEEVDASISSATDDPFSDDPNRFGQWGLTQLDIEPAWVHTKGAGVKVAVIDTGVDTDHPDFEGRVIRGYTAPGQSEGDKNGHGTHVAGIIGAGDNNQIAGAGVAPDTTIFEAKVTKDNGIGNSTWMAEGIVAAVNADVDVINISMTANAPMPLVEAAINQATARGITVLAAAGNDGMKGSPTRWPAAYDNVIAVGSVTRYGSMSSFSNTNDYVELTAPGSAITSTLPNGHVGMMSGTSQATPHVAGAAALLKGLKSSMSNTEIRNTLVSTTTGEFKTLNIHNAFAAVGFSKVNFEPLESPVQALKPEKPIRQEAPKAVNPIRHFIRPER